MNAPKLVNKRPKKKARLNGASEFEKTRAQLSHTLRQYQNEGLHPDTLFFRDLPSNMSDEVQIRTLVEIPVENVKIIKSKGKTLAWVRFGSTDHCSNSFLRVKHKFPRLSVIIHRPQQPKNTSDVSIAQNRTLFDQRCQQVIARGGIGNTLLFRKIPKLVESEEFTKVLNDIIPPNLSHDVRILRIRTSISKETKFRNFWCIFSNIDTCRTAFALSYKQKVNFRCGVSMNLVPNVHDDSTDADGNKRMLRSVALGNQESRSESNNNSDNGIKKLNNMDMLEAFLRQTRKEFIYLENENRTFQPHQYENTGGSDGFCCPADMY